jgi:hypothetical protein
MIVGTVLSANHLPKAMIMAKSFKKNMPGSKVVVGIIEEEMPLSALQYPYFDEVVLVKNICMYPNYRKFFFQYGIEEAVSCSKAQIMNYIYDKYTDEQIILYMDSDMIVMSPFDELSTIAENHPIIISGRFINPESFDFEWLSRLRESGIYYSGFLALKRHPEAKKFLLWWGKACERPGSYDHDQKNHTDQPWLDLAHNYFDDVYALRHPGYNVGHWNMTERWDIDRVGPDSYTIEGQPLRCIHFSTNYLLVSSWIDTDKGQIYTDIFNQYRDEMIALGQVSYDQMTWSYNSYSSGEQIADHARTAFSNNYYENPAIENPFLLTNAFFEPDKAPDHDDMISAPRQPLKLRRKYNKVNRIKRRRVSRKKRNPARKKRTR